MSTLITAANSAQAQRLKNKLNSAGIILGDHLELPEFMVSAGNMISLPDPGSLSYTHEMLTLCLDKGIATIYVLRPQELELLIKAEQLFKEYDITIIPFREIAE